MSEPTYPYQKFTSNDADADRFLNTFLQVLQPTMDDMLAYYNGVYKTSYIGKALYEKQIVPIYNILEKNLFIATYYKILEAEQTIGSINAYCEILYSIFGSNATITIDEINPMHIKIDIIARYVEYFVWVDEQKQFYITTEAGEYLGFAALVARISNRQLANILQEMTNAGVYLEFTYKQENPTQES